MRVLEGDYFMSADNVALSQTVERIESCFNVTDNSKVMKYPPLSISPFPLPLFLSPPHSLLSPSPSLILSLPPPSLSLAISPDPNHPWLAVALQPGKMSRPEGFKLVYCYNLDTKKLHHIFDAGKYQLLSSL